MCMQFHLTRVQTIGDTAFCALLPPSPFAFLKGFGDLSMSFVAAAEAHAAGIFTFTPRHLHPSAGSALLLQTHAHTQGGGEGQTFLPVFSFGTSVLGTSSSTFTSSSKGTLLWMFLLAFRRGVCRIPPVPLPALKDDVYQFQEGRRNLPLRDQSFLPLHFLHFCVFVNFHRG